MSKFKVLYQHLTHTFKQPSNLFLAIALIYGLFFIFTLAPLNGTDEFTHFPRLYQISEGVWFEHKLSSTEYGGYLPSNVNRMIDDYRNLSRESRGPVYNRDLKRLNNIYSSTRYVDKTRTRTTFTSTVTYPPWAYTSSLIGLMTAKALRLPLIWYVYLARLSSLVIYLGLTWLAIKLIPIGKWYLLAVGLLPTSLTQAATIGADGLLNVCSWLLLALVIRQIKDVHQIAWPKLLAISTLSLTMAILKNGYVLIALLILLIPTARFTSKVKANTWRIATLAITFGVGIALALRNAMITKSIVLAPTIGIDVNVNRQLSYINHHLFIYIVRMLWQPFTKTFDTIYIGIVGIVTNRLIYLSVLMIILLFISLLLGLSVVKQKVWLVERRLPILILVLVIVLGTYCMLTTAFYLTSTSVGVAYTNGLYGRYFLPILPVLVLIPATFNRGLVSSKVKFLIPVISILGLTETILALG